MAHYKCSLTNDTYETLEAAKVAVLARLELEADVFGELLMREMADELDGWDGSDELELYFGMTVTPIV